MRLSALMIALAALLSAAAFVSCGNTTEEFDCCVNGQYYECDDQDEFQTCSITSDEIKCDREPSKDAEECG